MKQSARLSGEHQSDDELLDLRSIFLAFRRRVGVFLSIALIIFTLVTLVTLQATPTYRATSSVMLDLREKDVADIEAVISGLPPDSATVDTEVEIIKSASLTQKVVDKLDLINDPEFNATLSEPSGFAAWKGSIRAFLNHLKPDQAKAVPSDVDQDARIAEGVVRAVQNRLMVSSVGTTYVIEISFTSISPKKAAEISNTFADQYLVDQLEAKFEATSRANEWLNERLGVLREELKTAENAVEMYRAESGLLSAEGSSLTEQQISDLTAQLVIQRAERDEAEARLRSVQSQIERGASADTIGKVLSSSVITSLRSQQAEVTRRKAELSSRYGDKHPEMLKVQREEADLQSQIDQEIVRIVSSLESDVDVAAKRVSSLENSLAGMRGELMRNNSSLVRLRELERNAEASRTLYENFLSRFKETGEQETLNEADARIVSKAAVPGSKHSPKTTLNIALGFVLGCVFGAGAVFLLELLDRGLNTGAQIEAELGVPFIASAPLLHSGMLGTLKSLTGKYRSPQDYLVEKPLSSFTESYRTLRSALILSNVDKVPKVVSITSALPGDGKTVSAYCLGRLSAMSGAKTIVVDCDLRRRFLSKLVMDSGKEKGLLQHLAGECELDDTIVKDDKTDCDLLPLVKTNYTPSDIFGSKAFTALLEALKSRYDMVILDTAPILPVAETRTITHLSDVVVIVAKWRRTKKDAVKASIDILGDIGANLAGVMLTQVNQKARSRYGYGDYGYYYSSYRKYYVD